MPPLWDDRDGGLAQPLVGQRHHALRVLRGRRTRARPGLSADTTPSVELAEAIWSGDGYVTAPLIDADLVAELAARYRALDVAPDHGFFASNVHADRSTARAVDLDLTAALGLAIARLLPGWEPFLGAFITKGPQVHNEVGVHQDWTYVDEAQHRSVLLWCPLIDVDAATAALRVVPGSHRWSARLRGSGDLPAPLAGLVDRLDAEHQCTTVPLRAGEAILYDAALLHGSAGNAGTQVRPAAAVATAPAGAPLVHYHREAPGPVEGYVIDEAYYTTQPFAARPAGYARQDPDPALVGAHDDDEVAAWMARLPEPPPSPEEAAPAEPLSGGTEADLDGGASAPGRPPHLVRRLAARARRALR